MKIEHVILNAVTRVERHARKILPFLSEEYFFDEVDRTAFILLRDYFTKYNAVPPREVLKVEIIKSDKIPSDEVVIKLVDLIEVLLQEPDTPIEDQWLYDTTEEFCQDRALIIAIRAASKIIDDRGLKTPKTAIPGLLTQALSIGFDNNIGHDFLEDYEQRYSIYTNPARKIGFDLSKFNEATDGGIEEKTFNLLGAGTGVGKTTVMCHMAAHNINDGHDVLYITMEMSETKIAERIEANLMNIRLNELKMLPHDIYLKKIQEVRQFARGRLFIKEYPTAGAGASHFRHLIEELRIKKNFKPKIVYIDYVNLCTSVRFKLGSNIGSYNYIKAISEELRGLAVEQEVAMWSATQLNRQGYADSDPGLEHTSDSFGLPMTADLMFILISSDELERMGQIMVKQTTKNRYADPHKLPRFVIGIDRSKMKLYDVEDHAQPAAGDLELHDAEQTESIIQQALSKVKKPKKGSYAGYFE